MDASSKKAIYAAFFGNMMVAITKFIAAAITGSSAMLSEGIHSVVDTGNQVLLLYGLRQARKPPDEKFPFGHGKEIYFWSFVVAIMIFAVGAGLSIFEGIYHIMDPKEFKKPFVNYVVIVLAVVFEGIAWMFAWREFSRAKGKWGYFEAVHRGKNPSIFVVLFEDSAAILGLVVAFVGILLTQITGNPYYDGTASIIIGFILGGTAVWLAYETKGLLIGESANQDVVGQIRKIMTSHENIEHVNEILTLHMGPDFILVNISVDFINTICAEDIESTVSRLDREIKKDIPNVKRIFIEAEARNMTGTQNQQ
jgi:cation diffusion facilitator family transporter